MMSARQPHRTSRGAVSGHGLADRVRGGTCHPKVAPPRCRDDSASFAAAPLVSGSEGKPCLTALPTMTVEQLWRAEGLALRYFDVGATSLWAISGAVLAARRG